MKFVVLNSMMVGGLRDLSTNEVVLKIQLMFYSTENCLLMMRLHRRTSNRFLLRLKLICINNSLLNNVNIFLIIIVIYCNDYIFFLVDIM